MFTGDSIGVGTDCEITGVRGNTSLADQGTETELDLSALMVEYEESQKRPIVNNASTNTGTFL